MDDGQTDDGAWIYFISFPFEPTGSGELKHVAQRATIAHLRANKSSEYFE